MVANWRLGDRRKSVINLTNGDFSAVVLEFEYTDRLWFNAGNPEKTKNWDFTESSNSKDGRKVVGQFFWCSACETRYVPEDGMPKLRTELSPCWCCESTSNVRRV